MTEKLYISFERSLTLNKTKVLVSIFIMALVLRIIYHYSAIMIEPSIRADALKYLVTAVNLIDSGVYSYDIEQPLLSSTLLVPGFPLALAVIYYFSGDVNQTVNLALHLQLILGSIIPVFAYLISTRFLPKLYALTAAITISIYPHQIIMSSYLLTETLFSFLMIASVYFLVVLLKSKSKKYIVTFTLILAFLHKYFPILPI